VSVVSLVGGACVRAARVRDLAALPDIEAQALTLFRPYGWEAQLAQHAVDPAALRAAQRAGRLFVAADVDDRAVGFILMVRLRDWAQLAEVDVRPEWGRRGIGRALVRAGLDWARSRGLERVVLSTMRDVPWNAPFYRRLGFEVVPPEDLPPELRRLRAEEARWGLPVGDRVVMTMRLAP
jgi:predicted N-acetyltransferase YhbS